MVERRAYRLFAPISDKNKDAAAAAAAAAAARSAAESAAALWRAAGRPGRALRLALALPPRAGLVLLAERLAHDVVARELCFNVDEQSHQGDYSSYEEEAELERRWSVGACVRALGAAAPDGEAGAALRLCRALAQRGAFEAGVDADRKSVV